MGHTACTEPQCLYRASVPVQGCALPFTFYLHFFNAMTKKVFLDRKNIGRQFAPPPTMTLMLRLWYCTKYK